jgi:tetratricopeptide (TPR) repeat protein
MEDQFTLYQQALKEGHVAAMHGQPKDALRHYDEAARLADQRALPHVAMGGILLHMGRASEALAAYRRALERAPEDKEALAGEAAALRATGQGDESARLLALARRRGVTGSVRQPAQTELATPLSRADVLHLTGEQARVEGDIERAVDAWLSEARVHADAGHVHAALDACQSALALASGAPRIHLELTRLYYLRGWQQRAVGHAVLLGRLLELAPDSEVGAGLAALATQHAGEAGMAGLASGGGPPGAARG